MPHSEQVSTAVFGCTAPSKGASVATVTFAHNSKRRLSRHIDALLRQTRSIQQIIVVDNASTDGTASEIAERYPQVTVLSMVDNLGAAGAWAAGLRYAIGECEHDWVWTFDDDSLPGPNVLATMLDEVAALNLPSLGIVAPMPVDSHGRPYPAYLWREGFVSAPPELTSAPVWLADFVIASGAMVSRKLVENIGLPRADFFMDIFDLEYCLRAASHGYKTAVVTGAKLSHEIGNAREIRLPGYRRRWTQQEPWREYYISRNLSYLGWTLYPTLATKLYIARYLSIHAVQVLMFSEQKLACLKRIGQGVADGLRASLGIRFRPN